MLVTPCSVIKRFSGMKGGVTFWIECYDVYTKVHDVAACSCRHIFSNRTHSHE